MINKELPTSMQPSEKSELLRLETSPLELPDRKAPDRGRLLKGIPASESRRNAFTDRWGKASQEKEGAFRVTRKMRQSSDELKIK